MKTSENEIVRRVKSPTPKFFKKIRRIGLIIGAVGATILASPIALPAAITTIGGYALVAGGVLTSISSVTVEDIPLIPDEKFPPIIPPTEPPPQNSPEKKSQAEKEKKKEITNH